jgi:hypothetical protein
MLPTPALGFGVWDFSGAWSLGFGAFLQLCQAAIRSTENIEEAKTGLAKPWASV